MMAVNFHQDTPLNILCLGAHCDDIEIGAGCTLLKIFKEYKIGQIHWIVFASNKVRKQEAKISAEQFLYNIPKYKVSINSFRDGFFPSQAIEIKEYFEEIKTNFSPDLIFTHYRNDRHQDHRLISDLTWNTWRDNLILEYEILKYDGDIGNPNLYVPCNEEQISKRNTILLESFESQSTKHWFNDSGFRALPRLRGIECATLYAEAFYSRKLVL